MRRRERERGLACAKRGKMTTVLLANCKKTSEHTVFAPLILCLIPVEKMLVRLKNLLVYWQIANGLLCKVRPMLYL
jgi:hypothetical protein